MKNLLVKFLALFMSPVVYRVTDEDTGETTEIRYVVVFGACYVLKVDTFILPPTHPNCRCIVREAIG